MASLQCGCQTHAGRDEPLLVHPSFERERQKPRDPQPQSTGGTVRSPGDSPLEDEPFVRFAGGAEPSDGQSNTR